MNKGEEIILKIKQFLESFNISYKYMEHEPTPTSEDAARVRGTKPEEGAKAIILKLSKTNKNVMLVLPGNLKVNSKKVKQYLNEDISFENPDLILKNYGVIIGGVPPFGNLLGNGIELLIDENLFLNENISFNCGKRTASITMKANDYKNIIKKVAVIGDFAK